METSLQNDFVLPARTNLIESGQGAPVMMIHGLAASLHDWDELIPELVQHHYSAYALDLLGHGESAHPESRAYQMSWMFDHMTAWIDSLNLTQPPVLIGHSLGGYLALEYACRFPARIRSLVLVDPFFRISQLPPLLRLSYRQPAFNMAVIQWTPQWLLRLVIDWTSLSMGHSNGGAHNLPEHIRAQTALDYKRTAPGVYNLPGHAADLTPCLSSIVQPTLVVWGTRDNTLNPASFQELIKLMPHAQGKSIHAGHVPHQSNPAEFDAMVLEFLSRLPE